MGLFDSTKTYERFSDKFAPGDKFTIRELRPGPTLTTDFGESPTFIVNVDGVEYQGFGAGIVQQAVAAGVDDFPADVVLITKNLSRNRTMKQLVPVGSPEHKEYLGIADDDDVPFD